MIKADAIIVGGGIAGASIAAELADDMRIVLLEQETQAGFHATGRSAAVFVPNYGDATIRALSRESRAQFEEPDDQFWPAPLFARRGLLRIVRADGLAAYRKQIEGAHGVEAITLDQATELFPILRRERFVEASYEADVHDIDVDALLQGYLRKARHHGARIEFGAQVTAMHWQDGLWHVKAGATNAMAPVIVNAAGAWADHIAEIAGVTQLSLRPCRRTIAVLPKPPSLADHPQIPFTVPFPLDWYAKTEGGYLLVSCAEEEEVEPHDAYADDMRLAEGLARFEADTTMTVTRVERSWAGLRTFSIDGYPLIGVDPDFPGFFWHAGQGGFGIQTAPAMAALAAPLIKGSACNAGRIVTPARFQHG